MGLLPIRLPKRGDWVIAKLVNPISVFRRTERPNCLISNLSSSTVTCWRVLRTATGAQLNHTLHKGRVWKKKRLLVRLRIVLGLIGVQIGCGCIQVRCRLIVVARRDRHFLIATEDFLLIGLLARAQRTHFLIHVYITGCGLFLLQMWFVFFHFSYLIILLKLYVSTPLLDWWYKNLDGISLIINWLIIVERCEWLHDKAAVSTWTRSPKTTTCAKHATSEVCPRPLIARTTALRLVLALARCLGSKRRAELLSTLSVWTNLIQNGCSFSRKKILRWRISWGRRKIQLRV